MDDRGRVQPLTQGRYRKLCDGRVAEEAFSSRRVRMVSVYVELEGRWVVRVLREDYEVVAFVADGLLDLEEDARQLRAVANHVERSILACVGLSSNVVEAEDRLVLASWTWKPTPREREGILEACRVPRAECGDRQRRNTVGLRRVR